jgi:hypothetical protein
VSLNETIELSEGDEGHHREIGFNKLISLILGEHSGLFAWIGGTTL